MAVLAFYNNADCDGLAANIKSQCKTHGLTSFTEVWPTACRCVQRLAVCCETGGFCIIAEISTVCKNFCSDPPDTTGGYGIRPYGVGGDVRHRPGSVVTAAMCRGRTMFAPTAPLLNCIVGRGLDPSARIRRSASVIAPSLTVNFTRPPSGLTATASSSSAASSRALRTPGR